jgi:hypothetical protein
MKQVDYTLAFIQAPINKDVYIEMPRGFCLQGKVFKLKCSLYRLKQSSRNFFLHLKGKLLKANFKQSTLDPCLFVSENVIFVTYVDDCLLFSPLQQYIDNSIE